MRIRGLLYCSAAALCMHAGVAVALEPEAASPGWSGFIDIGVGAGTSESNLLASVLTADLGDEKIASLDESPDGQDFGVPVARYEVAYTFASTRTQLFLGNITDGYLPFDVDVNLVSQAGARQPIPGAGTFAAALTATTFATEVWEDPYVTGTDRGNTERTTSGSRISWGNIFESPFGIDWKLQDVNIDDERSGEWLGLSPSDRRLLRREGSVSNVGVHYSWQIDEHNTLVPGIAYLDFDLDGGAMAMDGAAAELTHQYRRGQWQLHTTLGYRSLEAGDTNPIYGAELDEDSISVGITALYDDPFGMQGWTARASISYRDSDSNIDFYDASLSLFSIGMIYRFE